jgi:hypothetical protein
VASRPLTAAAGDRREELEALLWREKVPAPLVAKILAGADAYAKAFRPAAPEKPPVPRKPPLPTAGGPAAVHYTAGRGRAACRPGDPLSARGWAVSADAQAVTCGHCRKTPAWQEAAG